MRRRAVISIARFAAASSGLVVVSPRTAVIPFTPTTARSTVNVVSRRLVQESTAVVVRPRIVPGRVMTRTFS